MVTAYSSEQVVFSAGHDCNAVPYGQYSLGSSSTVRKDVEMDGSDQVTGMNFEGRPISIYVYSLLFVSANGSLDQQQL